MSVPTTKARASRLRGVRAMFVVAALAGLAAAAIALPAAAPAGQSSHATPTSAAQLGAGVYHSCALVEGGATPPSVGRPVRCWGYSGDGQVGYGNAGTIGDNETPAAAGPVDLGAGRGATALAVGDYHSCAVLDDGSVRCWGYNNEGQLGYGNRNQIGDTETPGSLPAPVNIGAGRTATAITAGGNHTCALLNGGDVRCWGLFEFGQLGYGSQGGLAPLPSIGDNEEPAAYGPVDFGPNRTAKAITAGRSHTCAILDDDSVRCWGRGDNGQLGYGDTSAVLAASEVGPVNLGPGRTARAITAGLAHTCAVLDDGSVRCWGLNAVGQLGTGNTTSIGDNEPAAAALTVNLVSGRTATAISAGGDHTCAVLDNGDVRCWGRGDFGQLGYRSTGHVGDNESPDSVGPVDLGPNAEATAVAAGVDHTCARLADGSVRCWGKGADGRLGLCGTANVGDDETPGSVRRVDLGAGGAACPAAPPRPRGTAVAAPRAPSIGTGTATEARRRSELRGCLADAASHVRRELRRAGRLSGSRRARLKRHARRHRAQLRRRCSRRHGRTPGRVTGLRADAVSRTMIRLTFRAPASDGRGAPPARSYVVRQSRRPIRSSRGFRRGNALCNGTCRFSISQVGAALTLNVTDLRPRTTYYYAVAARDNVSRRLGPRSRTVRARTR